MSTPYALGVDLGTTFTAAATWRDGVATAVSLGATGPAIPSVLFLREDGALLVGEAAQARAASEPGRVARGFKRRIADAVPYLLGDDATEALTGVELTGDLLRWVLGRTTAVEGRAPERVTLTHPAGWDTYRRDRLTEAAGLAGLGEVGLLAEPVAAAGYAAIRDEVPTGARLAVYDLGGGTFDAALIEKTAHGIRLAGEPAGIDDLGGMDLDQVVLEHLQTTLGRAKLIGEEFGERLTLAKETLSRELDVTLTAAGRQVRLTRGEFEDGIRLPLLRTVAALRELLATQRIAPADLHSVVLVGGSSRIPMVSRLLVEELRVRVAVDDHPKLAVCLGAAVAAGARLDLGPPASSLPAKVGADAAALLAPPPTRPAGRQPLRLPADLASAKLTEPADVAVLAPAPSYPRQVPVLDRDEPLVVRLGEDHGTGLPRTTLVGALAIILVAGLTMGSVAVLAGSDPTSPTTLAPPLVAQTRDDPTDDEPTFGLARLSDPVGISTEAGSRVAEVVRLDDGWVAVGSISVTAGLERPAAWFSADRRRWQPVGDVGQGRSDAQNDRSGAMLGVTATKSGAVASGWVAAGGKQVAAAWTTTSGRSWQLHQGPGACAPSAMWWAREGRCSVSLSTPPIRSSAAGTGSPSPPPTAGRGVPGPPPDSTASGRSR